MAGQPEWIIFLVALLAGIVGAVLAIFFQRVAIGIAGFMAGGYLGQVAAAHFVGADSGQTSLVAFVVVGVIVALLAVLLLDWALIGISAALGAALISQWAAHDTFWRSVVFVVLFFAGVIAQAGMMRRVRPRTIEET